MTQFWLCENIPFNNRYEHVVGFEDWASQRMFFEGYEVYTATANRFRFIDNQVSFRVNFSYEESTNLNYMIIQQDGKTFYLFIDTISYIDVNTTHVTATIDIWQTYMFEYEIKDALITREHQDRFTKVGTEYRPIYNLEPENIELGENYVVDRRIRLNKNSTQSTLSNTTNDTIYYLYIVTTEPLDSEYGTQTQHTISNIPMGFYLYMLPFSFYGDVIQETTFIYRTTPSEQGTPFRKVSELKNLYTNPKVYSIYVGKHSIKPIKLYAGSGNIIYFETIDWSGNTNVLDSYGIININTLDSGDLFSFDFSIGSLLPTFNVNTANTSKDINLEPKLLTKPFSLYTFTDGVGEPIDYGANELRSNINFTQTYGLQYKDFLGFIDRDYGLYYGRQSTKVNELPLMTDKFIEYMSRNKASATVGVALSSVAVGAGLAIATGGAGIPMTMKFMAGGLALNSGKTIINELLNQTDLRLEPNSVREVGNNIQHSLMVDEYPLSLIGIHRKVRESFYQRAYEYFYRLGYKANRFGVPNLRSRKYFNYIETSTINIVGNLNQSVLRKIEELYKKGMTIWHKRDNQPLNMYDYSKENWEVNL